MLVLALLAASLPLLVRCVCVCNESQLEACAHEGIVDGFGEGPLHHAARGGNYDEVASLVANGANSRNKALQTPLHVAVMHGHYNIVFLLGMDMDILSSVDDAGYTPLHIAALNGHWSIAKLLLNRGASVNAENYKGETSLHLAAGSGHEVLVSLLLAHGADANSASIKKQTPLHAAVENGHGGIVVLLLKSGAKTDALNNYCYTPLDVAIFHGHSLCARLLGHVCLGSTALHDAAWRGDVKGVQRLLQMDADVDARVDARDCANLTPLHLAAWNGHWGVIVELLDCGADIDARDYRGQTPLQLAALNNQWPVVIILMGRNADITLFDCKQTLLHVAAASGESFFISKYHDRFEMAATDERGMTALHYAAQNGKRNAVLALIGKGFDIAACDVDGLTPGDHARLNGHDAAAELIERAARAAGACASVPRS